MRIAFFTLPVALVVLSGVYYYFYLKRMAAVCGMQVERAGGKAAVALIAAVLVAPAANIWGFWAVVILYHAAFALLIDLANAIVKRSGRNGSRWQKLYRSGVLSLLLTALVLCYGYWNMRHVQRADYTVYTEKEIREQGYRVCLISDLHYGMTMDAERLRAYCKEIEDAKPDLLVLCGDIVDENTTKEQMKEVFQVFSEVDTSCGIYYVYGNHDRSLYSSDPNFTPEELEQAIKDSGIRILVNETEKINGELLLAGQDDRTNPGTERPKSSEELLEGVDKNDFLLLLVHQPRELEQNEKLGYDLQLSGHTHGGQIWPIGEISDMLGFGEMNYGYRKSGDFQVIVSSGMAGWEYPVRTGKHSEYVVIQINHTDGTF